MNKTERLFDLSSKCASFDATVLSSNAREDGLFEVVLDKTAFFPEEGGQSSDRGRLGDVRVCRVLERDSVITHLTDAPLKVGEVVHGALDFEERFRKMQNHTGEHIVSGLACRLYGLHNVGFHLGEDDMTADFDGVLDGEALLRLERLANEAVVACRKVSATYPPRKVLEAMDFRSKLDRLDGVRIVEIEGIDRCACCAPHVENTGEVGLIKITECVRYKGGVRVHIRCGFDALEAFCADYRQIKAISSAISRPHAEVAQGVEHLLEELGSLKGELSSLKREIRAQKLKGLSYTEGNLCLFEEGMDARELCNYANEARHLCGGICAVFSGSDETGYKYVLQSSAVDLRARSREINEALSGRGGGSAEMLQGSCKATREVIEAYFAKG